MRLSHANCHSSCMCRVPKKSLLPSKVGNPESCIRNPETGLQNGNQKLEYRNKKIRIRIHIKIIQVAYGQSTFYSHLKIHGNKSNIVHAPSSFFYVHCTKITTEICMEPRFATLLALFYVLWKLNPRALILYA